MPLLMVRLLWDPSSDTLAPGRRRFWRWCAPAVAMPDSVSIEERVDRGVRRRAVQALVREAYLTAVAEQDSERRPPPAFAKAWRAPVAGRRPPRRGAGGAGPGRRSRQRPGLGPV